MCDECLAPSTNGLGRGCDNMSVMVVKFKHWNVAALVSPELELMEHVKWEEVRKRDLEDE